MRMHEMVRERSQEEERTGRRQKGQLENSRSPSSAPAHRTTRKVEGYVWYLLVCVNLLISLPIGTSYTHGRPRARHRPHVTSYVLVPYAFDNFLCQTSRRPEIASTIVWIRKSLVLVYHSSTDGVSLPPGFWQVISLVQFPNQSMSFRHRGQADEMP